MREHAIEIAAVGGQQSLEDLLVFAGELPRPYPVGRGLRHVGGFVSARDELLPNVARQQQQRMLPNRALQLRDDSIFGEVREGVGLAELVRSGLLILDDEEQASRPRT